MRAIRNLFLNKEFNFSFTFNRSKIMKSTLKFALVVVSFAFLTACGGASKTETPVDSTATQTSAPAETPVVADTTTTTPADTTKKAQ